GCKPRNREVRANRRAGRRRLCLPRRRGRAARAGVAEQRGDVVAHLGEGVATQLPSLIEVVEPIEAGALVADGEFGDVVLDAEAGHQRATGAAQVVRGEKVTPAARCMAVTDFPQPLKARPVFSEAKTSVLTVAGWDGDKRKKGKRQSRVSKLPEPETAADYVQNAAPRLVKVAAITGISFA